MARSTDLSPPPNRYDALFGHNDATLCRLQVKEDKQEKMTVEKKDQENQGAREGNRNVEEMGEEMKEQEKNVWEMESRARK